ncbi:MAG: hypothetical protein LBC30_02420 [Puniceicoccales bacterium]|nr:hypothetical protein [Puniceicoccales bacterium]
MNTDITTTTSQYSPNGSHSNSPIPEYRSPSPIDSANFSDTDNIDDHGLNIESRPGVQIEIPRPITPANELDERVVSLGTPPNELDRLETLANEFNASVTRLEIIANEFNAGVSRLGTIANELDPKVSRPKTPADEFVPVTSKVASETAETN